MSRPLVSIIIPTFNTGPIVLETIASARGQTYRPLEVIVVDDCSTDDTAALLAPLATAGEIIYIRHERNQGQTAARKTGLRRSRGQYVSFVDGDDLLLPEKIERQVAYLETHPECGVCYSDIRHFWNERPEQLLQKNLRYSSGRIFNQLIQENFIQVMTALIRRELLEKYWLETPNWRRSDDWYLWLTLSYHGALFYFLNEVLCYQRRQARGTLSDERSYVKETAAANIAIYRHFEEVLNPDECARYRLPHLRNAWQYRLAIGELILGRRRAAGQALRQFRCFSLYDCGKKILLGAMIVFLPARWASRWIWLVRERRKRRSFKKTPSV